MATIRSIASSTICSLAVAAGYAQPSVAELIVHDPGFQVELYATLPPGVDGLAFTPGGQFSRGVYATTTADRSVHHITGRNQSSVFATGLPLDRFEPAFDPSGAFGGDLFVAATEDNAGPGDYIVRVSPTGVVTTFFTSGSNQLDLYAPALAFGPAGSAFSTDLYVIDMEHQNLNRFDPSAARTSIGPVPISVHDAKDLEFSRGGAWGSYAFLLDAAARAIRRVDPSGVTDFFLEWPEDAAALRSFAFSPGGAFGSDLYAGDNANTLLRIDSTGAMTEFISGLGSGKILATEFGDNELFIGTGAGEIYRVFPVPEPTSFLLILGACVWLGRRRTMPRPSHP